jgi:hypothetical protein
MTASECESIDVAIDTGWENSPDNPFAILVSWWPGQVFVAPVAAKLQGHLNQKHSKGKWL